jgi:hypothetical protein
MQYTIPLVMTVSDGFLMILCSVAAKETAIEQNLLLHQAPDDITTAGSSGEPMHINERSTLLIYSFLRFSRLGYVLEHNQAISEVCSCLSSGLVNSIKMPST